jgi:hypothetical protein
MFKLFNHPILNESNTITLPAPGPIAIKAVKDAGSKEVLSVREVGGSNRGKFVEIYLKAVGLKKGEPWCQAFVIFRLMKAAEELNLNIPQNFPKSGYTPLLANWIKKQNLWISINDAKLKNVNLESGDLVFFYNHAKMRIAHVGMVEKVLPDGVITIEGNTSDGVRRLFRSWKSIGLYGGFARLPF